MNATQEPTPPEAFRDFKAGDSTVMITRADVLTLSAANLERAAQFLRAAANSNCRENTREFLADARSYANRGKMLLVAYEYELSAFDEIDQEAEDGCA